MTMPTATRILAMMWPTRSTGQNIKTNSSHRQTAAPCQCMPDVILQESFRSRSSSSTRSTGTHVSSALVSAALSSVLLAVPSKAFRALSLQSFHRDWHVVALHNQPPYTCYHDQRCVRFEIVCRYYNLSKSLIHTNAIPVKAAIQRRLRSSFARTLVVRLPAVKRDGGFLDLKTLSDSSELSRMEEMRDSVRCRGHTHKRCRT